MGIWKMTKVLFSVRKEIKESMRREKEYLRMRTEELAALEKEQLYEAAEVRLEKRLNMFPDMYSAFEQFSRPQRIFFVLDYFEMEVSNGGLCQFFVNSSRMVAPYVSEYLGQVGAWEHKLLYDEFITKHEIDVSDLESFRIDGISEYEAQTKRYPFDEFDDRFYDFPPMEGYLVKLVSENIEEF